MKSFTSLLLLFCISNLFSQTTIKEKLEWGQPVQFTLPSTTNQTYQTINLHVSSILTVPKGVNLTITGAVQGGKIIFLGENIINIGGNVDGNGIMEIGTYSSLNIKGSINSNPDLTFLGNNTLVTRNISGGTITLNGNSCLRVQQLEMAVKFIGRGTNNNVNYNVPTSWGYVFSSPNISFSNNTNAVCVLPEICTPPANTQTYGTNEWHGYVYSGISNFSTATYIGILKENTIFDRNMAGGAVDGRADTRNIPCVTPPTDKFMVRYLNQLNLTQGTYNFTVGGDDGYRLSVDGGKTWLINNWKDQGYIQTSAQVNFTTDGLKNLVLEYYENGGDAHISFSYGKVEGDPSIYGKNIWHVYGYNYFDSSNGILVPKEYYSGYYTQATLGVDTRDLENNGWDERESPSSSEAWKGASVPADRFTVSHKREGFSCGQYEIKMSNWDDKAALYLDGIEIWSADSYNSNSFTLPQKYVLNENSKMELRLKEDGGNAGIKMELKNIPVILKNGLSPSDEVLKSSAVIIDKDYNMVLKRDLEFCSCTVAGSLTVNSGATLTIHDFLNIGQNGNFTVENIGSLVQVNNNAKNAGSISVRRDTAPVIDTDYTYWSSPVGSGFTLYDLSPDTPASKFYEWDPVKQWKLLKGGKFVMEAGKGYIVRAPQNFAKKNVKIYEATFVGEPNNGIITQKIAPGLDNLIGNPYPSAISADELYWANKDVIMGTFQFWTHNTPISSDTKGDYKFNYSADDYASYNAVGGVKTAPAISGGEAPTGFIASGQAFFIMGTETGGTLQFNNAMRVKSNNKQFFRPSSEEKSHPTQGSFEKHRLWLNITNGQGSFNETLIGYVTSATNGLDAAFDGVSISSGNAVIYSLVDSQNLVIQGRALPFSDLDTVPLGIKIGSAGAYTINMDNFDGLFLNQAIYLFDNFTDTFHDLKAADYIFTSEKGTFDNRFEIRYTADAVLGIKDSVPNNASVNVYANGNLVIAKSPVSSINSIEVYDLTGRLLFANSLLNSNTFQTQLEIGAQVVVIKLKLENQQVITKKLLLH